MPQTPNHGYNVPNEGEEDWHEPLNENFRQYDTDVEIRDEERNRGNYEPKAGAKFLATDTGTVFLGDGSNWQRLPSSGEEPQLRSIQSVSSTLSIPTKVSVRPEGDKRTGAIVAENGRAAAAGIYGENTNPDKSVWGVHGKVTTSTSTAAGVLGDAENGGFGVLGRNRSTGAGVSGINYSDDGGVGVVGRNLGDDGLGILSRGDCHVEGDLGVGASPGEGRLHVVDSVSGAASTGNHVAVIENTSDGSSDDVLALKLDEDSPGSGNNYISFKDATGPVGAIEGDGNGGVTTASAGSDYAEWLPRRDPGEAIEAGDIVGVHGGEVSLETAGADRVMAVSTQPIVTGNDPGPAEADRADHEKIAFVGQAPVKVRGVVDEGDLVVPSGDHDGTGVAVSPSSFDPEHGCIVGQAWEGFDEAGVTKVTVAVGLAVGGAFATTVDRQAERIDRLEAENEALRERLAALEAHVMPASGPQSLPSDD